MDNRDDTSPDDEGLAGTLPESMIAVSGPNRHLSSPVPTGTPQSGGATAEPHAWTGTFEEFFAAHYRTLLRLATYAGANLHDADEAASKTMLEVLTAWHRLDDPLAWAKKAVIRYFWKDKARNLARIRQRLIVRHGYSPVADDTSLTSWEEWQWIKQLLLDLLTPDQCIVMELLLNGFTPAEIAERIGASPGAVRQRLAVARRPLAAAWRQQLDDTEENPGEHA
ncbi:RNA polymerase sigma factor [Actinoplanes sp. CA-131856]